MQKVVKMLEQHVQWVALALGVIYLGWMVYSYVITPPVTVKLGTGTELYTPGTADEAIWRLQGLPLEAEINSKEEIHVKPKDMAGELFAKLKEENAKPTTLATNWPVHLRYRPESGTQDAPAAGPTIVSLPQVPAPVLVAVSNYVTTVLSPAAGPAAAPVAGAPGAGAAAPGAGAGAAPPTPIRKDINYVSCLYKIDKDALGKAFKDSFAKAGIPVLFETMFLEVEFYREEQDPADGKWGQPVLMATLPIYELMKYPGDQVPANPALQVPYFTFADWAAVNQEIIARPAFFETAPDAPAWLFPGETPPEVAPVAGAGGPAVPPARALEEKKRWMEAHRPMQPRGTGRPGMPYPGRPGMPPGPGSYYRPGGPGAPGGAVPPVRTLPSGAPGPGQLPYAPPSESHYRRPDGVPFASGVNNGMAGRFAANNITDDIQILAHDITVEQGKTYRYALSYKLVNPLFGFFDNNAPPAAPNLMNTFALASPPVEAKNEKVWGKPVAVEPRTKLWVTNVNVYGGKATFDVFIWTDGRYHQQTVKDISPGDPIGPSLWTVVDVRNDLRSKADSYVIVMDPKGNLFRRDAVSDKANPEHEKLKALATAAAAAR